MNLELPRFHVSARDPESGLMRGEVTAVDVLRETWVGDGFLGYLLQGETLIHGRWHSVEDAWGFEPETGSPAGHLALPTDFEVLDSYWGDRAEIVLSTPAEAWITAAWTDSDDHDHCAICWQTISQYDERQYWRNDGSGDVCCIACYRDFVAPRSLDFIAPYGSGA